MQIGPDWTDFWTAAEVEREFSGDVQPFPSAKFKFSGPGFYLSKTDTVLITVLPSTPVGAEWNTNWPEDTKFRVDVYNVPFSETIFAAIAVAPTRQDDR